jgi:beta-alanine--pyruvate transaminase
LGAVQLAPGPDDDREKPGREVFAEMFNRGVTTRLSGNTVIFSPPLILDEGHIDKLVTTLGDVLDARGL